MGAKTQMVQFAKEDLNLYRKLLEPEKSDADFNQIIAKVGHSNMMHIGKFSPSFLAL